MSSKIQTVKISSRKNQVGIDEQLSVLPTSTGVYQFLDRDRKYLYIGKAINLRNRVRQYFQKSKNLDARIEAFVGKIELIELIPTDSEIDALILEANLIKSKKPHYNVLMKDGKTYPYIVVTNEPFPRVFVTRNIIRDGSHYFGPFTDTFRMRAALKIVRDIFKIRSCNFFIDDEFIRKKKTRVCLDYHIKKCDGPCEGLFSEKEYNLMIQKVIKLLQGRTSILTKELKADMKHFADEQKFEEAAILRDKLRILEVYEKQQKVVDINLIDRDFISISIEKDDACGVVFMIREGKLISRQHYYLSNLLEKSKSELLSIFIERYYLNNSEIPEEIIVEENFEDQNLVEQWLENKKNSKVNLIIASESKIKELMLMCRKNAEFLLNELLLHKIKKKELLPKILKSIERDLRLKTTPRRIECFDISHIQGSDTVASMVQFVDAKSKKSEYRRYKIESLKENEIDDFKSMKEVVLRRYNRLLQEELLLPDLIIIDGGKGQLSSAIESLEKLNLKIPIISLAKRLEEVFLPNEAEPLQIPKTSSTLKLFQQIRDEAHRFALTYHTLLRSKRTLQTELDLIKGVGKKRAKELLESFGSVQGVKFASQEQLTEVVGEKISEKILEYFKKD